MKLRIHQSLALAGAALSVAVAAREARLAWSRKAVIPGDDAEEHEDNIFGLPEGSPLRKVLRRFFRLQLQQMVGFISTIGAKIPETFPSLADYTDPMASAMTPLIGVYWDKSGKALRGRLGLDPDDWRVTDPNVHRAIAGQTLKFCRATNETTTLAVDRAREAVRAKLADGLIGDGQTIPELTKGIKEVFTTASTHRARTIARTEAARAVHAAAVMSAQESGVVAAKRWLLSSDSCPVCVALAARTPEAPLDQEFGKIGNDPDYRSIHYPPAHPNCRCSMTMVLLDHAAPPVAAFVAKPKPEPSQDLEAGEPTVAQQAKRFPGRTITADQVKAYTANSLEKRVIFHQTYAASAKDLLKNGIDLDKANGVFGQGLYASTTPEKTYGPVQVKIALDIRNPLRGEAEELYEKWREWSQSETGFDPAKFSELARARGYDAIITGYGGHYIDEDRWFVICNPDQCRFIVPGDLNSKPKPKPKKESRR